jgi:hypothetical protein
MKRWLWILALSAAMAGAWVQQVPGQSAGDLGPGAQGSTLRLPGMDAPNPPVPALPPGLQGAWNALTPGMTGQVRSPQFALPPSNSVDINKDITITGDVGPWTILVMSYTTPRQPDTPGLDAAKMARDFVTEWNTNPAYAKFKLKAYVFNYGAEEKQKEYERVQKLKQEQIEALNKLGLNGKTMPIRVQTVRIDEHTAVLLGGFRDDKSAMNVCQELRKLKPDPGFVKRVKVDCRFAGAFEPEKKGQALTAKDQVVEYINPFTKAMPVRNPAAVKEQNDGMISAEEMKMLRGINSKEPLSLLNTKRPFTLAVKQFNTQFKATTDAKDAESFLTQIMNASGKKTGNWKDYAYQNAHNLADGLRKAKLEAYVLHCQCCSYVSIGSYNSPQDPELVQMQRFLETYFQAETFRALDMFERPMPMKVPGN